MQNPTTKNKAHRQTNVWLYIAVFSGRFSVCVVLLLLFSFLVQPVHQAYANESAEAGTEAAPKPDIEKLQSVAEAVDDNVPDDVPEAQTNPPPEETSQTAKSPESTEIEVPVVASEDEQPETIEQSDEIPEEQLDEEITDDENTEEIATETSVSTSSQDVAEETQDNESETDAPAGTDASTDSGSGSSSSGGGSSSASSQDDEEEENSNDTSTTTEAGTQATSTEAGTEDSPSGDLEENQEEVDTLDALQTTASTSSSTATSTEIQYVYLNSESAHEFSETECVSVGNGSFYCSEQVSLDTYLEDGAFAAPDADGDYEIYVRVRGVETQITQNIVDDLAPQFDARSQTITWHRQVNDRFQIILYNYETGDEVQLTSGNQNNMEPSVYGEYVAWQRWDGNDWEVVLFGGEEIINLSNNELPDIDPHINNGYVLWNTIHSGGEKAVVVYEIATGITEIISDSDGATVKNPRFVLVYEAEYENGDLVTRGFDVNTGKIVPLAALPADIPDEIPPVDQTGETRALIQNKSTGREDEVTPDNEIKTTGNIPQPTATTSDSGETNTLNISEGTTSSSTSSSINEIVVENTLDLSASSTKSLAEDDSPNPDIEDLVIPPPIEGIEEEIG